MRQRGWCPTGRAAAARGGRRSTPPPSGTGGRRPPKPSRWGRGEGCCARSATGPQPRLGTAPTPRHGASACRCRGGMAGTGGGRRRRESCARPAGGLRGRRSWRQTCPASTWWKAGSVSVTAPREALTSVEPSGQARRAAWTRAPATAPTSTTTADASTAANVRLRMDTLPGASVCESSTASGPEAPSASTPSRVRLALSFTAHRAPKLRARTARTSTSSNAASALVSCAAPPLRTVTLRTVQRRAVRCSEYRSGTVAEWYGATWHGHHCWQRSPRRRHGTCRGVPPTALRTPPWTPVTPVARNPSIRTVMPLSCPLSGASVAAASGWNSVKTPPVSAAAPSTVQSRATTALATARCSSRERPPPQSQPCRG